MASGDITILKAGAFGSVGTQKHKVASGAISTIKAGEIVLKALGNAYVVTWDANNSAKPVVGTDYVAGLAMSDSTDTAAADGYVEVMPLVPGMVFLGNANTAASWDTQAEYDALVGDRVLLNTTAAGVQTILHTDGATSGLVIMPLDVKKYPGKVAFAVRAGASYLA